MDPLPMRCQHCVGLLRGHRIQRRQDRTFLLIRAQGLLRLVNRRHRLKRRGHLTVPRASQYTAPGGTVSCSSATSMLASERIQRRTGPTHRAYWPWSPCPNRRGKWSGTNNIKEYATCQSKHIVQKRTMQRNESIK